LAFVVVSFVGKEKANLFEDRNPTVQFSPTNITQNPTRTALTVAQVSMRADPVELNG
jgi:hypothetical protein